MKHHSITNIILTTILVVIFGWSIGYIALKGLEMTKSQSNILKSNTQKAVTISAEVVNPNIPSDVKSTKKEVPPTRLSIIIGGDVMFDRGIRSIGERKSYDSLFDPAITTRLKNADISAVNLEGPITSNPSKTFVDGKFTDSFTFTFASKSADTLSNIGITIVSLANNHADNFGFNGYMETQDWLAKSGVSWFGNPWNSTSSKMSALKLTGDNSPIVTMIDSKGFKIAFVGYHSFQSGVDRVISEIKRVSDPDVFTIVMPHWGEEYTAKPSERMKSLARSFINAGADAVIGAHPHVIMEQEWVGAVPVYYSIGNLLFDQYFSPEVMNGNLVELHLIKDSSGPRLERVEVHNVYLKHSKGVIGE